MSFFNDIYECFKISEPSQKITISLVLGEGLVAVGNFKIDSVDSDKILLKSKTQSATICGRDLLIRSASRGELVLSGKVSDIIVGETR